MSSSKKDRKNLACIEEAVEGLCAEVAMLRDRVESLEGASTPMTTAEIIDFLDGYRAAEALAESGLGGWIAASDTPCLRGGLRVVQQREGAHARLFEERIKELGGSPKAELPEQVQEFFLRLGDERIDAEKVQTFLASAGDPKVLDQLEANAARMGGDEETQFLVRSVIEDERASLALLQQACELLCGEAA